MPNVQVNDADYYYELHGSGDPVVLIAGLKADHSGWMPILQTLAKDHSVLVFDNRGAGQTVDSGKAFDVAAMAEDTISLMDKLGITNPHVVGHSLGGAVAQVIAHKFPDKIRSVTLCNTFIQFNEQAKQVFSNTLEVHRAGKSQADIMSSIIPWVFSDSFITPDLIEIIRKSSNENPYPQTLLGYERQLHALYSFNANAWVDQINVPTLVIGSALDKVAFISESEELALRIQDAKLVTLSTGHASQVEQPNSFISALQSFYHDLSCVNRRGNRMC